MADRCRVLICYDGSEGSRHAVSEAARLFPGADATVALVWRPPVPYGGVSWGGQFVLPAEIQHEIQAKAAKEAERVAEDGARAARATGMTATAASLETTGPVWRRLLAAADDADADVIVAGSRGFGEVKALLLGSTSQALAHHARRALLIIPTPEDA